ncbi:MAG: SDR family NAD(P)-dependent oxidoreductase [Burkholderiales bacterium]
MSKARNPESVLITGATGGLGGALAQAYAAPGTTLILQGRNTVRLAELASACTGRGARVLTHALDLRNRVALTAWLRELCAQQSVDLLIVNAGVNTHVGPDGSAEPWAEAEALIEVNVLAAMATVDAVLPSMRARGKGQIALISSLAGYVGLPQVPSYSASKAALKTYGEALRGRLAPEGIRVNVVMPGYVASPMAKAMPGPKPFLWPAERAAQAIRRGLAADRARISFPFPLNLGTWWLSTLPPALAQRILRWMGYGG